MKSVIISVKPKWCQKIASGEKKIEVRKTAPQEVPFKAYIYCTKKKPFLGFHTDYVDGTLKKVYTDHLFGSISYFNGKVIGEFICDWVTEITPSCDIGGFVNQYIHGYPAILGENDCLSFNEMKAYLGNKKGYDWHISDLKIYDKPKELSEFGQKCDNANEIRCRDCLLFKEWDNCCSVMCKPLTRPPQSWRYVEEVMERSHKECKQ